MLYYKSMYSFIFFFFKTPMSFFYNPTIEAWFLQETEFSLGVEVRLASLYQSFVNYCESREVPPVELRDFTRILELLIIQHICVEPPKMRDHKGVLYKGIQLKPIDI